MSNESTLNESDKPIILGKFFHIAEERRNIEEETSRLFLKIEDINKKKTSIENEICKYMEKIMLIAYQRTNCATSCIDALEAYDNTGIFRYLNNRFFKCLNCHISEFAISNDGKQMILWYTGGFEEKDHLYVPISVMDSNDEETIAARINDICQDTVDNLLKDL